MPGLLGAHTRSRPHAHRGELSRTCRAPHARARSFEGLAYTSVACFCIEYITLFMGVSIFLRHITVCNILAHAAGLILTILFYADVSARGNAQAQSCMRC